MEWIRSVGYTRADDSNFVSGPPSNPSHLKGATMFPIIIVSTVAGTLILGGIITYSIYTFYNRRVKRSQPALANHPSTQQGIELADLPAARTPERRLLSSDKPLPNATPESHDNSSQWSEADSIMRPYSGSPGQNARSRNFEAELRSAGGRTAGENDDDDAWTDVEIREGSNVNFTTNSTNAFNFEFADPKEDREERTGPSALGRPK